jgi:ribonuclease P protein subunit RPR2
MPANDELNPKKIADERVDILLGLAKKIAKENPERARRYVTLARKVGMRYSVRLGERRRLFCEKCLIPLIPGATATVRISKDSRKIVTCLSCRSENTRKIGQKRSRQNLNK